MFSPIEVLTAGTHEIVDSQMFIRGDATDGEVVIELPDGGESVHFLAKKIDDSENGLRLVAPSGKLIDGLDEIVLLGFNQCLWLLRTSTGDYDIITGGAGGTAVGRDVESAELGADEGIGSSLQDVPGVEITLVLDTAGKVVFGVTGSFYRALGLFGASLGISIDGTDYSIAANSYVVGAGSDVVTQDSLSGTRVVFLTAGTYVVKMRAAASTTATLLEGATLDIDFPILTGAVGIAGAVPTGPAAGDLSGTYPDPLVVGLQGDSLPSMSAGEAIRRNIGNTGWEAYMPSAGGGDFDRLDKAYFDDNGFLPGTTILEEEDSFPPNDFVYGTTPTIGAASVKLSAGSPSHYGWDLGGSYNKVLIILGSVRIPPSYSVGLFIGQASSSDANPPQGYFSVMDLSSAFDIFKTPTGGGWASIINDSFYAPGAFTGQALYYDKLTGRLVAFARFGMERWYKVLDTTDSSYAAQAINAGIIMFSTSPVWAACPVGIYAE